MTKKTGKSKSNNKDRRHLKAVPPAPKMPLQLVLNHRAIDSMAVEFIQWNAAEAPDPADAFECLELVKLFLTAQHAINGSSSATAIDSDGVEQAAGAIAASLDPDDMDEAFDDIYFALHSYIHFLKGSGRWSGTDAAYEELHSALGNGIAAAVPQLPVIQVPDLSDDHQEAAFNAMPLIQHATSLLDWIGTGKEVTSTGALRLKDIEPAAAAVGVHARGKRAASRTLPLFDLETAESRPKTLLEVGTMHDVPVLREIWSALVGANLIRLGSTKAVPGPEMAAWNSARIEERLDIRRMLSVVLLVGVLTEEGQGWDQEAVAAILLGVLTYGTTDEPMPVADLEKLASPDLEGALLQETGLEDSELDEAGLEDSELEELYASYAALQAQQKLSLLAELGLVEAATDYRVPPVAIQCLDMAMGFFKLADEPSDATESPSNVIALHGPSPTGRPPRGR
ncbi:hypothetical protein [Pseudarthrobacter cellobiosi]|uniref:hypothetical protein n=1 Tax=Pseudarthrobacter cellobiosi TaxID=2953654 RepID=UPI00208FA42D|nr:MULTISPECIES: hypothetical protein [unclassified Pseudarthrobacter]MCO4254866.1 hypothetical protein [Pseudarthrobacter sp. HLT1-5]MCO4274764.1 hypothetical protein [Pseudarthrobacter sp. HLT3-5]